MDQRWTLHVENIGKVLAADIQIAPLICFVGDNNSGKSYIMTLLWGVINNGRKELLSEVSVSDAESSGVYKPLQIKHNKIRMVKDNNVLQGSLNIC